MVKNKRQTFKLKSKDTIDYKQVDILISFFDRLG